VVLLGACGVVAMGWIGLAQILRADAFAKFQDFDPSGTEVGVTLTDVSFRAYEKGRLAAVAQADQVEVRRDRSLFEMNNVRNGKFIEKEGDTLAFEMQNATFEYFRNRLTSQSGAHVRGEDFDLKSDEFTYEQAKKTLFVEGQVRGKLNGGDVKAKNLTLLTGTKEFSATDVMWVGELAIEQDGQRKQWTITGNVKGSDGNKTTYSPGRATDGEVIVMADTVVYTKDTDTVHATGNVKYFGEDANMLCDDAMVFRKERRAVFTGVVRMVVKAEDDTKVAEGEVPTVDRVTPASLKTNPQGATKEQFDVLRDSENVRKFPIKVIADKVEYWYRKGERRAVITGNPFARQDLPEGWRTAWAHEAFYDGEKETLTMKSRPSQKDARMVMSIGDDYVGTDFTFSTRENDKNWSGNDVTATVFVDDDEIPTRNTGGGTGGGTTGGGR
jgi:lipopolysaccharide export system protein LptA